MTQRGSPASSPPPPLPPQQHSIGPSSPRSGIEVARHEDEDEDEAASSTSLMPPPMPELKALKKACPNAAAEERSNLRGEVSYVLSVNYSGFHPVQSCKRSLFERSRSKI